METKHRHSGRKFRMDCIIKISTTKLTDIMMMRKFILFFFLWFQFGTLCAQVTVKTNLLGWGTASINGGIETKVSAQSTISLSNLAITNNGNTGYYNLNTVIGSANRFIKVL